MPQPRTVREIITSARDRELASTCRSPARSFQRRSRTRRATPNHRLHGTFPPAGWSVVHNPGGAILGVNTDFDDPNETGGEGLTALTIMLLAVGTLVLRGRSRSTWHPVNL